jgi:shikimate kinase
MRYFLLGYMGSGKTTLGRALSQRLEVAFIDLDAQITAEIGRSIASFMEDKGELAFRKVEHHVLERLLSSGGKMLWWPWVAERPCSTIIWKL